MKKSLLILALIPFICGCMKTENGEKTGTIIDFEFSTVSIETSDHVLIRGGFSSAELIPIAKEAFAAKKQVKVKYYKETFAIWNYKVSNYAFQNIEIIS